MGRIKIGSCTFDISAPQYVLGVPFKIEPMLIADAIKPMKNIIFIGGYYG